MRGSNLDRRITIEQKSITQDPNYGTEVIAWTVVASRIPAQVQDALPSKSETTKDALRMATQPSRVRIRYRSDITSDMRITVHGSSDRIMQIVSGPAEIGRREWLEMMVEAYTS